MTVRTLKRGEGLAPGPSAEFTYPRGVALGEAGKALYVTDSGQLLKEVDLSSSPHPVDTLLGQEGCGWADGSAATARLWLAKGCPWTPPVGGSGGGDGESAGCSPQEGCPDGRGSPRLFVVHAESRSGSSWLTSMITLSPQVYVHDECERSEAPGGVWKVSGSHLRGRSGACSFELLRSVEDWPDIEASVTGLLERARHAYPRPVAAGFKLIDSNHGYQAYFMERHVAMSTALGALDIRVKLFYLSQASGRMHKPDPPG